MNKPFKILIRTIAIIAGSLIALFAVLLIFLSVLFPNELVKKNIEKYASEYLGTELKIEKLKFSVFSGFLINNLTVKQYGSGWSENNIISIGQINLSYKILPLIFSRTLTVKAFTVKNGQINLEKNGKGANWDYFINRFNAAPKKTGDSQTKDKNKKSGELNKNDIPVNLDLNKAGLENFTINYTDSSFLNTASKIKITGLKLLAKNINAVKNSPFNLEAGCMIKINSDQYLDFETKLTADGKIKIFDGNTGKIALSGPIDIKADKGYFISKNIKALVTGILNEYLSKELGPVLKPVLKNADLISGESDRYFNDVLENSDNTVNSAVGRVAELMKSKTQIEDYKKKILGDYDGESPGIIGKVDKKIEEIDEKTSLILDTAEKIPFVSTYANIGAYREKAEKLKTEITNKKNDLIKNGRISLTDAVNKEIKNNFPEAMVTYDSLIKDFKGQVAKYKTDIKKNLSVISDRQLFSSIFSGMDYLNKNWEINTLSTTYYLGKKEPEAKDININLKYFISKGSMKMNGRFIDYTGDMTINLDEFKIDFMPVKDVKLKIAVNGNAPDFKYAVIDSPKISIDADKLGSLAQGIIKQYLNSNYSGDKTIKTLLGNIPLDNPDIEGIKNNISADKINSLADLKAQSGKLEDYAEVQLKKLIKEIKGRIPGLN